MTGRKPRLLHADADERRNWRLIGDGLGVHWPDLDEDVSIEGLLVQRGVRRVQSRARRATAAP